MASLLKDLKNLPPARTMQEVQQLHSSYLVTGIVNAFFCYTAIMLNIVTIQAIRKTSSLSKTLKAMLLSLAVSDLGVGLLVQPLFVARCAMDFKQVSHDDPTYNITFTASLVLEYIFATVSFLDVMVLITDRFLVIHLHLRYKELVTSKRIVAVLIFIWVFSAILSVIRLLIPQNIFYAFVGIIMLCCITTTAFLSVKIYLNVRSQLNQIQVLLVHQKAQNGHMANTVRLRKFAVAAVYVYLVFLVCYLPYACARFAAIFVSKSSINITRLQLYCLTLLYFNSSLNPLVYCLKMKHIRRTMMDMLRNTFSNHIREITTII